MGIIRIFLIFGLVTLVLLITLICEGTCVYNTFMHYSSLKMHFCLRILYESRFKQCLLSVKWNLGEHAAVPYHKDGLRKTDQHHHSYIWLRYRCIEMEDNTIIQCSLCHVILIIYIYVYFNCLYMELQKKNSHMQYMYLPLTICDRYRVIIMKLKNFTNYSYLLR